MRGSRGRERGEVVTAAGARLCLWAALAWAADHERPSQWSVERWERLVRHLSPREIVVLALHQIRGLTHTEVGAWLGVSRGRTDQHWRSARLKLQRAAGRVPA